MVKPLEPLHSTNSPDSESRRRRNHGPPKSGIPNRKKTGMHTRLSCKIDYLLRSNHRDRSIASSFFTDDYLVTRLAAQTALSMILATAYLLVVTTEGS